MLHLISGADVAAAAHAVRAKLFKELIGDCALHATNEFSFDA
jgi:hypothetical protein